MTLSNASKLQQEWRLGRRRYRRWSNRVRRNAARAAKTPHAQRSAAQVSTLYFFAMLTEDSCNNQAM